MEKFNWKTLCLCAGLINVVSYAINSAKNNIAIAFVSGFVAFVCFALYERGKW